MFVFELAVSSNQVPVIILINENVYCFNELTDIHIEEIDTLKVKEPIFFQFPHLPLHTFCLLDNLTFTDSLPNQTWWCVSGSNTRCCRPSLSLCTLSMSWWWSVFYQVSGPSEINKNCNYCLPFVLWFSTVTDFLWP